MGAGSSERAHTVYLAPWRVVLGRPVWDRSHARPVHLRHFHTPFPIVYLEYGCCVRLTDGVVWVQHGRDLVEEARKGLS